MNCSDWLPTSLAKTFSSNVLCGTLESCRTDCRTEMTVELYCSHTLHN